MKKLIIIILLLSVFGTIKAQWERTYAPGGFNAYFKVFVIDNKPVITQDSYTFFQSSDNGLTWDNVTGMYYLYNSFVNELKQVGSRIYAATKAGLYYTDDKAQTWKKYDLLSTKEILRVHVNGNYLFAHCNSSQFFYSTDNGANWSFYTYSSLPYNAQIMQFENLLISYSNDFLEISEDFGKNWISKSNYLPTKELFKLVFAGNEIYAYTSSRIYKSNNLGDTWSDISNMFNGNMYYSLIAYNNELILSTNTGFYKTEDNRTKVNKLSIFTDYNRPVYSMYQVGDYIMANAGSFGFYKLTISNPSQTLITQVGSYYLKLSQLFEHKNKLFLNTSKNLFIANNKDMNWEMMQNAETNAFYFPSDSALFKIADNKIYISLDAGIAWRQLNGVFYNISAVTAYHSHMYLLSGNTIYHSENKGETWEMFDPLQNVFNIKAIHAALGKLYLFTEGGIFLSTDNGKSATLIKMETPVNIDVNTKFSITKHRNTDLFFAFKGTSSTIYYSSDNGINWHSTSMPTSNFVFNAILSDGNYLYATTYGNTTAEGDYKCVLISQDNAKTWTDFSEGIQPGSSIKSSAIFFDNSVFLFDFYGHIWTRSLATSLKKETEISELTLNCFPNPVDDLLHIEIPDNIEPKLLRITNANGKVLYETKVIAQNSIPINFLPKGMYFVTLICEKGYFSSKFIKN